ncbi:YceI family protein [Gluconobacter sphaericus]|uniref:YceI family protein n=1 Tax=Gluconobacter sphaericus TaxID=574987 RepID=UPI001B8BC035|nr:YceI family protein [Gluconobacter sphaericus]MBS1085994.1 YceI family protein [Gluconobacter sphaericus]MBS1099610.1 YceI family protein [Gluconobacter sphaericus]
MAFLKKAAFSAFAMSFLAATPVFAVDWTIDPAHSTIGFAGTQTGNAFTGHFGKFDGTISFDPAHPEEGHAKITIDIASATTADKQRDGAMPGSDWFNVASFPTATFEARSFRAKGGNAYEAVGTLTIRGVSRPETLPFTLDISGQIAHAKGHLDLIRSAFGIGQGPWATGQWVALQVGVSIDVIANQTSRLSSRP